MTGPLHFVVDAPPVAKARARAVMRRGKVRHYTPEATVEWQELVAVHAKVAMRGRPLFAGPMELLAVFLLPVPEGWPAWKRAAALTGQLVPTTKPDWDNLGKAVADALNGVAWTDDAQVVDCFTRKRYAALPCVVVFAQPLNLLPAQVSRRPLV